MAATLNPAGIPAGLAPALPKRTAHASIRRHLAVALGLSVALVE